MIERCRSKIDSLSIRETKSIEGPVQLAETLIVGWDVDKVLCLSKGIGFCLPSKIRASFCLPYLEWWIDRFSHRWKLYRFSLILDQMPFLNYKPPINCSNYLTGLNSIVFRFLPLKYISSVIALLHFKPIRGWNFRSPWNHLRFSGESTAQRSDKSLGKRCSTYTPPVSRRRRRRRQQTSEGIALKSRRSRNSPPSSSRSSGKRRGE